MATLEVTEAVRRAHGYPFGVISHVDADGFPATVAAPWAPGAGDDEIVLGPLSDAVLPAPGEQVGVVFSHIRPQPGVGYDERRYVNVWGTATVEGGFLRLAPQRATGWDEAETPFFEYAEKSVPAGRDYMDRYGVRPRLSAFWTVFLATRLPFLTATVVPVALGGAIAGHDGRFALGWWVLCLLAAVAAHLGINVINDVADADSGADAANTTPTPFSGGSRVIQYGLVSRRTMARTAAGLYAVTAVLGLVLAATRSWSLLWIGALALVLGYGYTAKPFRFVHRGLGEPVVALGFGPIMAAGTYLAVTRAWSWEPVYASVPVGILIALVLYVNQVPDRRSDAATGKRTLIVRWPAARVVTGYAVAAATAFGWVLAGPLLGITPVWTLLALGGAYWSVRTYRVLRERYDQPYGLMPAMQDNIVAHLATGLLLTVGYLVSTAL
jgi:1,4-dihydroxy-2-naphthoate octaprenyltransferase